MLRRATAPMTAREIADALIADKAPQATRKQAIDCSPPVIPAYSRRPRVLLPSHLLRRVSASTLLKFS